MFHHHSHGLLYYFVPGGAYSKGTKFAVGFGNVYSTRRARSVGFFTKGDGHVFESFQVDTVQRFFVCSMNHVSRCGLDGFVCH